MTHSIYPIACNIIDNDTEYPNVIVAYAKMLKKWHDDKTEAAKWLWEHRGMWHQSIRFRKEESRPRHRSVKTHASLMMNSVYRREELSVYHKHVSALHNDMGLVYGFRGALHVLKDTDHASMLSIVELVNAGVLSKTASVPFERVSFEVLIEILLWKLTKQKKTSVIQYHHETNTFGNVV